MFVPTRHPCNDATYCWYKLRCSATLCMKHKLIWWISPSGNDTSLVSHVLQSLLSTLLWMTQKENSTCFHYQRTTRDRIFLFVVPPAQSCPVLYFPGSAAFSSLQKKPAMGQLFTKYCALWVPTSTCFQERLFHIYQNIRGVVIISYINENFAFHSIFAFSYLADLG